MSLFPIWTRSFAASAAFLALFAWNAPIYAQRSVSDAITAIDSFKRVPLSSEGGQQNAAPTAAIPFVPPPRSIGDITAILDQQKPDPAKVAAAQAFVSQEPPAGAEPSALVEFYFQRSLAANNLGRAQQQLDDAKKAVELAAPIEMSLSRRNVIMQQLGFAYQAVGDFAAAIAVQDDRVRAMNRSQAGQFQLFSVYHTKVYYAARAGRLDLARDAMSQMERLLAESSRWQYIPQPARDIWRVLTLRARAAIALETGRPVEAEADLRAVFGPLLTSVLPNQASIGQPPGLAETLRELTYIDLGRALMAQNRLVEAETEIRRSLLNRIERHGRYSMEVANDLLELARVVQAQGRIAEAERLALAGCEIVEKIGHGKGSLYLAALLAQVGVTQSIQGKTVEAKASYQALETTADTEDLRRRYLETNTDYALFLLRSERVADSMRVLETALKNSIDRMGEKAYPTAQARGWLGYALARQGQKERALVELQRAAPVLLAASDEGTGDEVGAFVEERDRQTQEIVEAYLGLLADTGGPNAAEETFRLADGIRGKSVQRALAAASARASAADATLANLARYEQDAQKQIVALQSALTDALSRPSQEQSAQYLQSLRSDIDKLRSARAILRREIQQRFPEYSNLIDPKPATLDQAQRTLKLGEALIATYVGKERLYVWGVPHQGNSTFSSSKVSDLEVENIVADLRKALDPNADSLEAVPAFDVALSHRLYELLLKPVEAGWRDASSLLIVPHKALGQLPMSLLVTERIAQPAKTPIFFAEYAKVPFLVRKLGVTQLPSVMSLITLRALPAAPSDRLAFAAFGDPWFSAEQATEARSQQVAALQTRGKLIRRNAPTTVNQDSAELAMLPRLPDTADEVRSIAAALRADMARDVFLGDRANELSVRTSNLANRKVVMFATHGLVPGDLNGLTQPALALSAPNVARIDGDGLLTMEEILALKLNADWVILSACNTATGAGAGAEAISGLGRAFFYAGTRALLVSNWPVETVSARELTTDLFRRQADNSQLMRSEALRQSMVALIDSPGAIDQATNRPVFSYAHPIFWAPFSLVGDGS